MNVKDKVVLVTGANRGLGRALVEANIQAGARRIYAAARNPKQLQSLVQQAPEQVVPLHLDITNADSLEAAAERAPDVAVLFNNAGVLSSSSLLTSKVGDMAHEFTTNVFGTLAASKAFLPALTRAGARGTGQAAMVNVLSVVSLSNMPAIGSYSASKAALFSITQALRADLAKLNISVHGVFAGPIDTDMARDMNMPKTSAAQVAEAILSGLARGIEDIFPDPMAERLYATWRKEPKELEKQLAALSG